MCCTLLHIILGTPQGHHILLLPRLGEGDLDSIEPVTHIANVLPLRANNQLVELVVDNDIFGTLIFLKKNIYFFNFFLIKWLLSVW